MSGLVGDNTARASGVIASAGGGGKILQILETTTSATISMSSASPTGTGLLQAITPTAASSKILVTYWTGAQGANNNGWSFVYFDVAGGGYAVVPPVGDAASYRMRSHTFLQTDTSNMSYSMIHSPSYSLGQEITYQVYGEVDNGAYPLYFGKSGGDSNNANYSRTPSGIRLEEIAA